MWRISRLGWIASIAAVFFCQGCGTGEYSQRMDKTLKGLRSSSSFNVLYGASKLQGTEISIRMPQTFKGSPVQPKAVDESAENLTDPLQPLVKLPGLKSRWEATITDTAGAQTPYYCYLAAAKPDSGGKTMDRRLAEDVMAAFHTTDSTWQEAQYQTPDGGTINVKRMTVNGDQPFACVDKDGKTATKNLPSSFDVFLYTTPTYDVVVAWAVPTAIAEQAKLDELKTLTAGSISVP